MCTFNSKIYNRIRNKINDYMKDINFEEGLKTLLNILDELKKETLSVEEILSKTKQAKEIYSSLFKTLEEAKTIIENI